MRDSTEMPPSPDAGKQRRSMRAVLERRLAGAPEDKSPGALPAVADHVLLERIGRGAYGEVWLARNALGTLRAVKVVFRAHFEDEHPYEREFHGILKYEPVSRTHEGLVQILHVGRNDDAGCFYYVMELADDLVAADLMSLTFPFVEKSNPPRAGGYEPHTLRSAISHGRHIPPTDAARLVLRLAGAVGHLHAHGLVHRDIKPGNVVFVSGQPKLADIGLVTDVGTSHSFVGTEGFIPPEGPGAPQADLYSLGKLLYELATGRDRMDFPQLPPDVARSADGEALLELNEVMTRACEPAQSERYASATELQADLNSFLAGRSLRRARNLERYLARLKKLAAAACMVLVLAAVALWFSKREARHASERARSEAALRQRAEAAERASQEQLRTALIEQARATVRSSELGQRLRTLDALRRAAAIAPGVELRREAVAALALPDLRFEHEIPLAASATCAALDPKFERLAVGHASGAVEIRTVPDQRLLATLPASTNEPVTFAVWSPDGRFLAFRRGSLLSDATQLTQVEVWDVSSARHMLSLPRTPWSAFAFHPMLPRILSGDIGDSVSVWDLESGETMARFALTGLVHQLAFSPDGGSFLAQHRIGWPWHTSLLDAATGAVQHTELSDWIDGLAWHPNGRRIAMATRTGEVILADARSGERSVLGRHPSEARTVAFSPDGDFLFTGGEEQEIICWDLRTRRRAFTIGLGSTQMQFANGGTRCAVLTRTAMLLHRFERAVLHRELPEDLGGNLRHAAFSPNGRWLAVGGYARMGLWDLTRKAPATIAVEAEYATPLFSPDSSELFAISYQDHGRWQIAPGANAGSEPLLTPLPKPKTERIFSGQFPTNSLVLGTADGVLIVPRADIAAEGLRHAGLGHFDGQLSPDGQWLVARNSMAVIVHQLEPWDEGRVIPFNTTLAHGFTPGGDELAVATRTGITFLDTTRWGPRRTFAAPLDRHARLLFAPDGHTFWLARDARTAALHDLETFETLLPLPIGMIPLALSPDGRHLAVSVDAQRLQVWDLIELRARLRELGLDWRDPL